MRESSERIRGMFMRYLYLHKRSVSRALELIFWPVMELMVWGFVTMYIREAAAGPLADFIIFLISAIIFWDLLYRSQQGVSISFVEDIWTQNIANLLISPLRLWEWITATFLYGMMKTALITAILAVLAWVMYQFNLVGIIGLTLVPLMANLLIFGWSLGILTSGLLVRWGHSVEALIWGIPFLIQPLSAIYYPLDVLPPWVQVISKALPSTYVFEGMRAVVKTGQMDSKHLLLAFALNAVYFLLAGLFFAAMYSSSRRQGKLARLGVD